MDAEEAKGYFEAATAGSGAIKGAIEIARSVIGLAKGKSGDEMDALKARLAELQSKLIDAQEEHLARIEAGQALKQELRRLEERIAEVNRFDEQAQDYKLVTAAKHTTAYIPKTDADAKNAGYLLCPKCFDARQKSYLNLNKEDFYADGYRCPSCGTEIWVENDKRMTVMTAGPPNRRFL